MVILLLVSCQVQVPVTEVLNVTIDRVTFQQGDPRATRNGQPLAYTFELSATRGVLGTPINHFAKEVTLVWNIDFTELAAAGVKGWPLHVYTYDEIAETWREVRSWFKKETNQLIATTPHFSIYSIGTGFDKIKQYVPTINGFEVDLQSGTASIAYPINLPLGPRGIGPQVSLSYNSGSIDRIDTAQQGSSTIGWGWTLSTSYIAASQHHFTNDKHP